MAKRRSSTGDRQPAEVQAMPEPPAALEDQGLSLDQLTEAFAQMLGSGSDPYVAAPEPADAMLGGVEAPLEPLPAADDDSCEITPRSILEAMLFVGHPQNEPLAAEKVAGLMRGVRSAEIDELVIELNAEYEREGRPYHIASIGDGYRLNLRDEFIPLRDQFFGRSRQHRLSTAALEVLSLVAYQNAISGEEVNKLRGSASGAILAQLVRRQLLSVERTETKPRQMIYRTTKRFLELFGLASLDDLPRGQDLDRK